MDHLSLPEKLRRQEILKFPFESYKPLLNKTMRSDRCKAAYRKSIYAFHRIIDTKMEQPTEILEKTKFSLLSLESKTLSNKKETAANSEKRLEKPKFVATRYVPERDRERHQLPSHENRRMLDGPEEISNCPDLEPRRMHVYQPKINLQMRQNRLKEMQAKKREVQKINDITHINSDRRSPLMYNRDDVWHFDIGDDIRNLAGVTGGEATNKQNGEKRLTVPLPRIIKEEPVAHSDDLRPISKGIENISVVDTNTNPRTSSDSMKENENSDQWNNNSNENMPDAEKRKAMILELLKGKVKITKKTLEVSEQQSVQRPESSTNAEEMRLNGSMRPSPKDPRLSKKTFSDHSNSPVDPRLQKKSAQPTLSHPNHTSDTPEITSSTSKSSDKNINVTKPNNKSKEVDERRSSNFTDLRKKSKSPNLIQPTTSDKKDAKQAEPNKKEQRLSNSGDSKKKLSNQETAKKTNNSKKSNSTSSTKRLNKENSSNDKKVSQEKSVKSNEALKQQSKPISKKQDNASGTQKLVSNQEKSDKISNKVALPSNNHSDSESSDDDDRFQRETLHVILEVSKEQRHRYDKRRGRRANSPRRQSLRSKRLQEIKTELEEIQQESEPLENLSEILTEHTEPEASCQLSGTNNEMSGLQENEPTTEAVSNIETNETAATICDELDEIKKEIIEKEMEVGNFPVEESPEDTFEQNELFSTPIKIEQPNYDTQFEGITSSMTIEDTTGNFIKEEVFDTFENTVESLPIAPINIKMEPLSVDEVQSEYKIERVQNFTFINHPISFQFKCLLCHFASNERTLFRQHILLHEGIEWDGFCNECDAHVIGEDRPLQHELDHMLTVHVKGKDVTLLDNDLDEYRPPIKLRRLDDILSTRHE